MIVVPYAFIGMYMPKAWKTFSVIEEVYNWIITQPKDKWKRIEQEDSGKPIFYMYPYALSTELESWMRLKWG